jgi:hypothetical protein
LTDRRFAALPPHFIIGEALLSDAVYKDIIGGFGYLPQCFRPVIPYLVASLVHHKGFLSEHLAQSHPLFHSRLWVSGLLEKLSEKVLLGCGENTISQMTATGVSPTLVLANQLDCLTDKVKDVENNVSMQKVELMAVWKESFEALPELVSNHIRETLEITGAVNVTQADVIRIVTTAFEVYASRITPTPAPPIGNEISTSANNPSSAVIRPFFDSKWRFHKWADDTEQYFPEGFSFPPSLSVSILWDKWHFNGPDGQAPYRKLSTLHVSSGIKSVAAIKTQKGYLSKSKAIMDELANILKNLESITKVSDLYEMNYELSRAKFSESYLLFVKKVYRTDDDVVLDNMRIGELKYNTLYDNWKKLTSKKRVRPDTDDNEASSDQ